MSRALFFFGCLTSGRMLSVYQHRICLNNFTCRYTEIEARDHTCNSLPHSMLTLSQPVSALTLQHMGPWLRRQDRNSIPFLSLIPSSIRPSDSYKGMLTLNCSTTCESAWPRFCPVCSRCVQRDRSLQDVCVCEELSVLQNAVSKTSPQRPKPLCRQYITV